jgi:hypothetical protein
MKKKSMKKTKVVTAIILMCLLLLSCKESFEKKVYFNFSVGGSKANAEKTYEKFREENNPSNLSKYPFYKHQFKANEYYYSSPLFQFAPNDTIIHTLSVFYTTKPQDLNMVLESAKKGNLGMQPYDNRENVTPIMVFDDIFKELETKYGKCNYTDTINSKPKHLIKQWTNKDGIDIRLDYAFTEEQIFELIPYYSLILKFTLTDELKSSLIKNKSVY